MSSHDKPGRLEGKGWGRFLAILAVLGGLGFLLTSCNGSDGLIPTHSISGKVTSGGSGLAGVSIVLSGAGAAVVTSDANGNYSFHGLANGTYTITPSNPGFVISPFNSQQVIDGQDIVGVNFTVPANPSPTFSVSGTVSAAGVGLVGVTMSLSGASAATAITDANGNYSFIGLRNGSYTVAPGQSGFLFAPAGTAITINGANLTAVNYAATATGQPLFSVIGTVSSEFGGVAGITLTLGGPASATANTDANGKYSFTNLPNGNYTVTPAQSGYLFTPASSQLVVTGASLANVDFVAAPTVVSTCSLSGAISANGSGVSNLTVVLGGSGTAMVTTDANGNYSFSGLANGNYTITPQSTSYSFTPVSGLQTIAGVDVSGVDFLATANSVPTFTISGSVTAGGNAVPATALTLSGSGTATANTDRNGVYTFSGLANGTYTVTPVNTGFVFNPTSSSRIVGGQNVTGVDFVGTASQPAQVVTCPGSGVTEVTVVDFAFTPANLFVGVNGIVRWSNDGPSSHTVSSGTSPVASNVFDSGTLSTGGTVCVQFLATGTNFYFCRIHPFMTGSVTVQ